MPYSYFNSQGELVGLDIEMAYALAAELGLEIEFVPVSRARLAEAVNGGLCDLVMSGITVTTGAPTRWFSRRPILTRRWALSCQTIAGPISPAPNGFALRQG